MSWMLAGAAVVWLLSLTVVVSLHRIRIDALARLYDALAQQIKEQDNDA